MVAHYAALIGLIVLLAGCGTKTEPVKAPETSTGTMLAIRAGTVISPEGKIGAGEWADADSLHIRLDSNHTVTVQYKHDAENLAVRFTGVTTKSFQVEPELLLDLNNSKDSTWQADDLLLHVGYQDCEGRGGYENLECGILQRGWFANNLPASGPGIVEMKISFSRLGLKTGIETPIGLAFALQKPDQSRVIWPATAETVSPATWGTVSILVK
jgi:hypothetical protein